MCFIKKCLKSQQVPVCRYGYVLILQNFVISYVLFILKLRIEKKFI